jgi:hypothetical protein
MLVDHKLHLVWQAGIGLCEEASPDYVNYSKRMKPGKDWWMWVSENLERLTADNRELHIVKRIVFAGLGWRLGNNLAHCSRALRIQLIELNRGGAYGV